ncbi:MAG: molybdopterin-dependent oxidoreductase [Acidobacteriota bacterium]|nr:molybdopterin-dependent oxidoreductase [Acidobacteriota bacterium]
MERSDGPVDPGGEPAKTAPGGEASDRTGDRPGSSDASSVESAPTSPAPSSRETGQPEPPEETRVPAPVARTADRPARRTLADRLREPEETAVEMPASAIRARTRRDFLLFGAGALAAAGGLWWLLPDETRELHLTSALRDRLDSLEARLGATPEARENLLNRALTFDDDVAEALYSADRSVRTYSRSQVTPLRNNYNGATPGPSYIPGWTLSVSGLASERTERLAIGDLLSRFQRREQVTRICCVEGWSAVAWWSGLRFSDFLHAYPPAAGSSWAKLESSVNLDGSGKPDPYYVSIDLATARHAQTLLATHLSGRPLSVEHGAPLRLLAPMKLGLKNIKAITSIEFTEEEPEDYWNERGYSKYDGL